MHFPNWYFFLLLIPLGWVVWEHLRGRFMPGTMRYSDLSVAKDLRDTPRVRMKNLPFWLRVFALTLLIVAAARPQYGLARQEVVSKGIDIMICLDRSGSMSGIDMRPGQKSLNINEKETRINVAKQVIRDFIKGRRNDRLGLVVFAGRAYTQCPMTLDYGILLTFLDTIGISERDSSTAIGDAIGTSVIHLKNSDAKSRVVILVTDGENNSGMIDPITAAKLAAEYKIKIYTVGVGSREGTVREVRDFFGSHYVKEPWGLDEATLQEVSRITGARYFPAGDADAMRDVFQKIDQMEKTEIKTQNFTDYSEHFLPFALLAFGILLIEVTLRTGYMRSIP